MKVSLYPDFLRQWLIGHPLPTHMKTTSKINKFPNIENLAPTEFLIKGLV
jgi:hypothetical protein